MGSFLETWICDCDPNYAFTVALYRDVVNAKSIKEKAVKGEINCSLIKPEMITDAFKKFGIGEMDKDLLIAEIHKKGDSQMGNVIKMVDGEATSLNVIPHLTDEEKIKKIYKVKDDELVVGSLVEALVGRIAAKEFVAF